MKNAIDEADLFRMVQSYFHEHPRVRSLSFCRGEQGRVHLVGALGPRPTTGAAPPRRGRPQPLDS